MQARSITGRRAGQGGFTLVEMAVVLVIIGVIIGAVMIGRDVQRNAEYTRIKQKFVDQWVVTYNSYQQRYGAPIGDNQAAPQLMDFLGAESRAHFDAVRAALDAVGLAYRINPRLVRGMDYYNLTVFEWVTD